MCDESEGGSERERGGAQVIWDKCGDAKKREHLDWTVRELTLDEILFSVRYFVLVPRTRKFTGSASLIRGTIRE